ncbi:cysteine proteinase [Rhizodiscina lignyota]|uniref:Cysteine proteinase n=1 Tax=Rhizodiscina lignyota TaxID=1504668 RepID=A0A9P4IPV5_9PEZI|nr:cysteine proteinase [Rhizodiscina lignyota]
MAAVLTYNADHIQAYYERIKFPQEQRKPTISGLSPDEALSFLKALQKYTLVAIPFENLNLHYGRTGISLHPEDLYRKIVGSGVRGGYCMENNFIFGTIMRSLGYNLYNAGARVCDVPPNFNGWGHMINIVTIGDNRYAVDVGFGANGQTQPLLLDKSETVHAGITPASKRVVWRNIAQNTNPHQRLWVYEHRNDDSSKWQEMYCFTDLEFLPADYDVMNYYTSTSRQTFFTHIVLCSRMIFGGEVGLEDEADEIVGVYILYGETLKKRLHGENEVLIEFKSEDERLKALEDYFGISFNQGERSAINGLVSAIQTKFQP